MTCHLKNENLDGIVKFKINDVGGRNLLFKRVNFENKPGDWLMDVWDEIQILIFVETFEKVNYFHRQIT